MAENSDGRSLVNEVELNDIDEDIVRTYGSTVDTTILKPNVNKSVISDDTIVVKIEDIQKDNKPLDKLKLPEDVLSKDSDSLINDVYYSSGQYDSSKCWWRHPKVRENWKIVLSAFVLLIIGMGLLIAGIVVEIVPNTGLQGFVFWIAGFICFVPGAYHVVYVYCAVKGRRGYDFYHLPLFN